MYAVALNARQSVNRPNAFIRCHAHLRRRSDSVQPVISTGQTCLFELVCMCGILLCLQTDFSHPNKQRDTNRILWHISTHAHTNARPPMMIE